MDLKRLLVASLLFLPVPASSQVNYGRLFGRRVGEEVVFEPTGVEVLLGAQDPVLKKWYVPQELYRIYGWKQWEYTNYAREHYRRYVDIYLEGSYYYDLFGRLVTRGWQVYRWQQDQPERSGSSISKDRTYNNWFDRLLIASDSKGQYHMALTIGDEIRTTLTPLTLSKPLFNGSQFDFQSDKYSFTALLSRISLPIIGTKEGRHMDRTNNTNLLGLRGTVQVGQFLKVGATYVNAHQSNTLLESFSGSPLSGSLTTVQNSARVSKIIIRISDDSPEDGEGGAALYSWDIVIRGRDRLTGRMETVRGSQIDFEPIVEGGYQRPGYLAADGEETITLTYDFTDPSYAGPDPSLIERVIVELVLANDYRVEWTSDRQTNKAGQPVFLLAARAPGNVKDNSNMRVIRLDYGLPTANEVYGFTVEVDDFKGFDLYAEFDRNRRFRQYPNVNKKEHHTTYDASEAWMVNMSKLSYPYFAFFEAYSIDYDYSTTCFIVDDKGAIDYEDKLHNLYEFVDDNDDQDRYPDWGRLYQRGGTPDDAVFPGWDENNDFISDFNENDNLIPDYEEPFLRYDVDPPEFLFGMDMNHNMWVDRFENDEEPDYPYKRDHRGYNFYFGVHITPDMRLIVGHQYERLLAERKRSRSDYFLFTFDRSFAGLGRLRMFGSFASVKDNIPDNLIQWVQTPGTRGTMKKLEDPLAARDARIGCVFVGFDYTGIEGLNLTNKLKLDLWDQRRKFPGLRDRIFLGLINKVDYTFTLGRLKLQPRIKNLFRREVPVLEEEPERKENLTLFSAIAKFPVLKRSEVELGAELAVFRQLMRPVPPGFEESYEELTGAVQLTNRVDYMGYRLTTQIGMRVGRKFGKKTSVSSFITVYAGTE